MHPVLRRVLMGAVFVLLASNTLAADLRVDCANLHAGTGTLYVALFDSADGFPSGKSTAGQYIPVSGTTAAVSFLNLKPGRYAVSIYQDLNGNGKLDANLLGVPTEPYGFSRDATGTMGPPAFDAAAIDLTGDASITVHLR